MQIKLDGLPDTDATLTLAEWTMMRGVVEVGSCDDPSLVTREYDGTVTITGRIVSDANRDDADVARMAQRLHSHHMRFG